MRLGDKGQSHSPIYGFSTDGFPIYGPYQASGQVAVSCWQKRDYRSSSPTGCSTGTRSCVLTNPLNYSQGKQTVSNGPSLTSTLTSLSGNPISGASGIYKQDYFYNASYALILFHIYLILFLVIVKLLFSWRATLESIQWSQSWFLWLPLSFNDEYCWSAIISVWSNDNVLWMRSVRKQSVWDNIFFID